MSSVQQPLEYVSRASRLDRILRELLHQTPGVEAAAVVSFDGTADGVGIAPRNGRGPGRCHERSPALVG